MGASAGMARRANEGGQLGARAESARHAATDRAAPRSCDGRGCDSSAPVAVRGQLGHAGVDLALAECPGPARARQDAFLRLRAQCNFE